MRYLIENKVTNEFLIFWPGFTCYYDGARTGSYKHGGHAEFTLDPNEFGVIHFKTKEQAEELIEYERFELDRIGVNTDELIVTEHIFDS